MKIKGNLIAAILFILVINIGYGYAHGQETFAQAEEIIKQKIPCDNLTEDQLEILGDYYMEQMHPGELHEIMDERMGGEGSESLRQIHINMGLTFYCGERGAMSGGMMNIMMGRGMMNNYDSNYGMMGSSYYNSVWTGTNIFGGIIGFLVILVLILLIVLLIKKIQKPWRRR